MVTPVHRALGEKGRYKSRMFDFFVKNRLSPQELAAFIAVTLGCPVENVLVVTSSELQGIPPVELNALRCLCLYWHAAGEPLPGGGKPRRDTGESGRCITGRRGCVLRAER